MFKILFHFFWKSAKSPCQIRKTLHESDSWTLDFVHKRFVEGFVDKNGHPPTKITSSCRNFDLADFFFILQSNMLRFGLYFAAVQ